MKSMRRMISVLISLSMMPSIAWANEAKLEGFLDEYAHPNNVKT